MDKMNSRRVVVALGRRKSGSQMGLPAVAVRVLVLAIPLSLLAFAPRTVRAQAALQSTQIAIGAPAQPHLGGPLTVQAVLADSQGHPISKAVIYFTTSESFLRSTSDVVLAQAVTNAEGQAVAQFVDNFSGTITLKAEFRGDAEYAPSNAAVDTSAAGEGQVYTEHVGLDIPGFNVPPIVGASRAAVGSPQSGIAGFVQDLWPAMNGWPVAAALLIVWSIYLFAVKFVFRVAALGGEGGESESIEAGSSL
jgi:hypothetical protein